MEIGMFKDKKSGVLKHLTINNSTGAIQLGQEQVDEFFYIGGHIYSGSQEDPVSHKNPEEYLREIGVIE